jgi:hypothetical protein
MSAIISNRLFLGGAECSKEELLFNGITHVVNFSNSPQPQNVDVELPLETFHVCCSDSPGTNLSHYN